MLKLLSAPSIRDMRDGDLSRVLEIERAAGEWNAASYRRAADRDNVRCLVIEREGRVVGTVVYAIRRRHFELLHIVVDPDYQRRGIGTELIDMIRAKLARHQRREILAEVSEWNTAAQLFLRACGFRAEQVLRAVTGSHDTYLFRAGK